LKKKLIAIILAVSLGVVLGSYLLLGQSKPNINDSPNKSDATSSPVTSTPNVTSTEPPKTTSEAELNQTIPTPTVPEFTITLTNHSSDTPTTYSTDPFTGQTITHPGVHYEWQTLDITIKHQPFTPIRASTDHGTRVTELQYNVRYRGHFAQDWFPFGPSSYIVQNSTLEYTVVSFVLEGRGIPPSELYPNSVSLRGLLLPANATVDFQVEALNGYFYKTMPGILGSWIFIGKESDWSEIQTLTIP